MSGAPTPPVIPEPFASHADPANINVIPDTTAAPGVASWSLGFPPITMIPKVAGGIPPLGQDFNGVGKALSAHDYFVQAGQLYPFNATVAGLIGGYKLGAQLIADDGLTIWWNQADGNTTNPNDDTTSVGWIALPKVGFGVVALTNGTRVLKPSEYRFQFILLTGTLTGNVTVVFPKQQRDWLVINACAGAFSVTAITQGSARPGVAIPAGGLSTPTGVYSDGTDMYPTVAPLSVAIDQAATPSTVVERTNTADVLVRYINQYSNIETGLTADSVMVQDGGDGYLRKFALAGFLQQIFASPTFTGAAHAATVGAGDSSTRLATTAFANPGQNLTAIKGHVELPGGLLINWGFVQASNVGGAPRDIGVTFDKPFPVEMFGAVVCTLRSVTANGQAANGSNFYSSPSLTGMVMTVDQGSGGLSSGFYIAIGK